MLQRIIWRQVKLYVSKVYIITQLNDMHCMIMINKDSLALIIIYYYGYFFENKEFDFKTSSQMVSEITVVLQDFLGRIFFKQIEWIFL